MKLAPRSGLAWKHSIDVGAGVIGIINDFIYAKIDYDYRGNVGVILFNFGDQDFVVNRGDRIAQLIIERICVADAIEVDDLPSSERGDGGFGSTGIAQVAKKSRLDDQDSMLAQDSDSSQVIEEALTGIRSYFNSNQLSQEEYDRLNHAVLVLSKHNQVCGILRACSKNNDPGEFRSLIVHLLN